VPSTERLSASGVILLDGHLRVTESDNLGLTTRTLNIDSGLLRATGSSERLVEGDLATLVGSHYFLRFLYSGSAFIRFSFFSKEADSELSCLPVL
jgi:hypothetical protein